MLKFLSGMAFGGLMMSGAAMAADVVPVPAFDWTGVYFGAQVGVDMLHPKHAPLPFNSSIQPEATGASGGLSVQVLKQSGQFVFGGVADFNLSTANASAPCRNVVWTCADGSNWNGSIRAKLGVAPGKFMIYGTGGWGWADFHGSTLSPANVSFPDSKVLNGWVAGGGISMAINPKWTANIEYLHYDLGSGSTTTMAYDSKYVVNPNMDTVTFGLSYKF